MFDLGDFEVDAALKRQWRVGRDHGTPAKVLLLVEQSKQLRRNRANMRR